MKTHNTVVKLSKSGGRLLPGKHLPIPSRKASRIAGHEKLICLALSNCLHIVECLHASRARQLYGVLIVPHCHFVSKGSRWRVCFREAKYALVLSSHHNYVHPRQLDSVLICRERPCRPSSRLGKKQVDRKKPCLPISDILNELAKSTRHLMLQCKYRVIDIIIGYVRVERTLRYVELHG